jgi:hypothetical protein
VVLRPWLQAFGWRTKTYSPGYILEQVGVAKQNGGIGFLFWNARNDYSKPFLAMPEMRGKPSQYFRGDEVRASRSQAPSSPATEQRTVGSVQADCTRPPATLLATPPRAE